MNAPRGSTPGAAGPPGAGAPGPAGPAGPQGPSGNSYKLVDDSGTNLGTILGVDTGYPWPYYQVIQNDAFFAYGGDGQISRSFQPDLLYSDNTCTGTPTLGLSFDDSEGAPSLTSPQARLVQNIQGTLSAWSLTGTYTENASAASGFWYMAENGTCTAKANFPVGGAGTVDLYTLTPATAPLRANGQVRITEN